MKRRHLLGMTALACGLAGCFGDDSDEEPGEVFGVGEIAVYIDEAELDLSADRFQAEYADEYAIEFHLHEFDDQWYMEGDRRVTVSEALDKLPEFRYEPTPEGTILEIDDTVYDAREPTVSIGVRVNEQSVDPSEYTLEDGDDIVVVIHTG